MSSSSMPTNSRRLIRHKLEFSRLRVRNHTIFGLLDALVEAFCHIPGQDLPAGYVFCQEAFNSHTTNNPSTVFNTWNTGTGIPSEWPNWQPAKKLKSQRLHRFLIVNKSLATILVPSQKYKNVGIYDGKTPEWRLRRISAKDNHCKWEQNSESKQQ